MEKSTLLLTLFLLCDSQEQSSGKVGCLDTGSLRPSWGRPNPNFSIRYKIQTIMSSQLPGLPPRSEVIGNFLINLSILTLYGAPIEILLWHFFKIDFYVENKVNKVTNFWFFACLCLKKLFQEAHMWKIEEKHRSWKDHLFLNSMAYILWEENFSSLQIYKFIFLWSKKAHCWLFRRLEHHYNIIRVIIIIITH